MNVLDTVLAILDDTLGLRGRGRAYTRATPLLGAVPELDSMAVVALITALEEHFGFMVEDDELVGDIFATVGSLADFVQGKLAG